jgi:opacity protein-like surface antigen
MTRPVTRALLVVSLLLAAPATARADLTAFVGASTDPGPRFTRGLAVGFSLIIVGFEFEWSGAPGDRSDSGCAFSGEGCDPSLTTGMVNVLLQTPRAVLPLQLYGTAGVGVYRERFDSGISALERQATSVGTNIGGGAKIELFGPLRLRLDYRVFRLAGDPVYSAPQRFYAGVNLAF